MHTQESWDKQKYYTSHKSRFNVKDAQKLVVLRDFLHQIRVSSPEKRGDIWLNLISHENGEEVFKMLLISKGDNHIKMEALLALQLMGEKGIRIMKEAYPRSDPWTRSQIIGCFAFLKNDMVVPEIVDAVNDASILTEKRMLALNALKSVSEKHESKIIKLLDSRDPAIRSRIARLIAERKLYNAKDKLKRMLLEEKDLGVIYSLIESLNELGENLTVEEVMNMRDGTLRNKRSILRKLKEIAKRYGNRVLMLISAIIAIFFSLGYALSTIKSFLNIVIKNSSKKRNGDTGNETV
ncbi:MAG: HEAT repeat domain-containing protein [Candidatus Micrarchaeia archaeon]